MSLSIYSKEEKEVDLRTTCTDYKDCHCVKCRAGNACDVMLLCLLHTLKKTEKVE